MSRIPESFIDDLLSRVDIVNVVDSRVKLKRTGKNYAACCPFHQEKTPSFTVSPDKQFYYCFGCGAAGNAIGFVMEYERESFVDAVENLAKLAGVEVPREENDQFKQQDFKRKKLFDILERANDFFVEQLKTHPQRELPVNYLKGRELTGQIAKDFGIGFAPPGRDNLLLALGKSEDQINLLIDAGLVIHKPEENKKYDRFRHRITFPIRDERGRVIGFGGRVLGDDKPKYLNSPETDVFHKGKELYGLYQARKNRQLDSLLVVEGYMDVIALAQYGIENAVATLGTACGEEHLKMAFRFVDEVVFCFDGDNAGRTAAKRALLAALPAMTDGRQTKFLFLPEGQDPDSLVRQIGRERFIANAANAVPLEEFLFDVAADGINIRTMDGRARFSKVAAPLIAKLPEGIFRELMLDNLAQRTGLSREVLNELQQEKVVLIDAETSAKPVMPLAPSPSNESDSREKAAVPNSEKTPSRKPAPTETSTRNTRIYQSATIRLNPARIATILLLEHPELLGEIDNIPELDGVEDVECQRLLEIIGYLKKRPNSNFNNILGFWGGAKGLQQQHELADLMANQLLRSAKTVNTYDPLTELKAALARLEQGHNKHNRLAELNALKSRDLQNLTSEERNRLIELTRP